MTTDQIIQYYVNLLIMQYYGLPKASATIAASVGPIIMDQLPLQVMNGFNLIPTVQTLTLSAVPASGDFTFRYGVVPSSTLHWNSTAAQIQTVLNTLIGFNAVVVTGSMASKSVAITFSSVTLARVLLAINSNTIEDGSTNPVNLVVAGNTAQGVQLDIIGKYCGVSRTGNGFNGPITLDDADFLSLIQVAIIRNNSGSSLATIQNLLHTYFPNELFVFDFANMNMSYMMSSAVGSQNLAQLFVSEGLLPKPMGVQLATLIYAPIVNTFFGFRTYDLPGVNNSPFNTYDLYNLNSPWLSYNNGVVT